MISKRKSEFRTSAPIQSGSARNNLKNSCSPCKISSGQQIKYNNRIRNSKTRFSDTVAYYDLYRPNYPKALVDWIINITKITPSSNITDIGCGTGISTRLFAQKGFRIIGIDPNEDMLASAVERYPRGRYQKGDSEHTTLPDNSIDLVISAQAFHWFHIPKTLKEFKRILIPGGFCCAFWNVREDVPIANEYKKILKKYSTDYEKTPKALDTINAMKQDQNITNVKEAAFLTSQKLDLDGLIGRAYSTSYVAKGVKDRKGFKQALAELFKKYQIGERVKFPYKTVAICWQFETT